MYLSRLYLNLRSRQVRSEITNPYEMHRTVIHAFIGRVAGDDRVLFRLEAQPLSGMLILLVQSPLEPDWSFLTMQEKNYLLPLRYCPAGVDANPGVKSFDLNLDHGQQLRFRLRANPTVKKSREGEKQGKRIGLYREEEQLQWLQKKLKDSGAELVSVRTSNGIKLYAERKHPDARHKLSFMSVQFDGVLQVQDPAQFVKTVWAGVGSGKGLGFGLLSLAPIRG